MVFQGRICICHLHRIRSMMQTTKTGTERVILLHDLWEIHIFNIRKSDFRCNNIVQRVRTTILTVFHRITEAHFLSTHLTDFLGSALLCSFHVNLCQCGIGIIALLQCRCIDNQWFDGTSRLFKALESTVQRVGLLQFILGTSADHCHDFTGFVVDNRHCTLELINSGAFIHLRIESKFFIKNFLQIFLCFQIHGRSNFVSAGV